MQYPIDTDNDGIPASVTRDPVLAERLAYKEDSIRTLAQRGIEGDAVSSSLEKKIALAGQRITSEYYRGLKTSKQAVKAAIERNDPKWLDPEVLHEYSWESRYWHSSKELEELRAEARFLEKSSNGTLQDGEGSIFSDYPAVYAGWYTDKEIFPKILEEASQETVHPDRKNDRDDLLSDLEQTKVYETQKALFIVARQYKELTHASSRIRTQLDQSFIAVVADVVQLGSKIHELTVRSGLNPESARALFLQFDLSKYNLEDFDAIAEQLSQGVECIEALETLYATESSRRHRTNEFVAEVYNVGTENSAKRLQSKNEQEERKKSRLADFIAKNPIVIAGRSELKRKIETRYPELKKMDEIEDSNEGFEAIFDTIDYIRPTLTAFTIKASEEFSSDTSIVLPLVQLDVFELWRKKFAKPKGYYGGETGRVRIKIWRPAEEDPDYSRIRSITTSRHPFAVDITIEGVKSDKVEIESTLNGLLYTIPHVGRPTEGYAFKAVSSRYDADEENLRLHQQASRRVARAAEVGNILRPFNGGKVDGGW